MNELVKTLLVTLLNLVDGETIKEFIDKGLDTIEDKVAATPNKFDDAIVLPLCDKLRDVLDVPDND